MATAHCQLGGGLMCFQNSLQCLEEAALIDNLDTSLRLDIKRVKVINEALELKCQADEFIANDNIESAITFYKKAVLKENTLISAKVNCATAYLLQRAFKECIHLCEEVLNTLKATGPCKHGVLPPIGTIPLPMTERRKEIVLTTLCKKAEAYANLKMFDKALLDLEMAKTLTGLSDGETKFDYDINLMKAKIKT